jgi:hypothetical protein
MLINNDFAFLPIPKNASTSIVYSVLQWGIKTDFGSKEMNKMMIEQIHSNESFIHCHTTYDYINNMFPNKKIIGIRRPSADRFLSALKYMIFMCKKDNIILKYNFEKISESEIIEIFTKIFYELSFTKLPNLIDTMEVREYGNKIDNIIKENITKNYFDFNQSLLTNFHSQYLWGLNKCDIILDISELNQFTDMIKKIKPNFNLIKMNDTPDVAPNIEKSDKIIEFAHNVIDFKWLNELN